MTGADIRAFRAKHKLSQFRMAVICGVTQSGVQLWERRGTELQTLIGEAVAARMAAYEKSLAESGESA